MAPLNTLEKPLEWAPVSAPPHDGSLNREAEFAAMKAKLEALELANERRQAKLDAMEVENKRLMSKVSFITYRHRVRNHGIGMLKGDTMLTF